MYSDLSAMKSTLEKVLTLEEFKNADQYVSLLSYSSRGDMTTHFNHVKVSDVMAPGSLYVEEIRKLQVTGMTCISQALQEALALCNDEELTCISLHSDGYANDYSPYAEKQEIEKIIKDFSGKSVYVNTLAYREYSDFNLLNSIANALSGKCILAKNIREIYDALHDASSLLAGHRSPAIVYQLGTANYQIFVSKSDRKINGCKGELKIMGLSADGDKTIYRYREVTEAEYDGSSLPERSDPIYAYAKAMIAEGRLNDAKFALVSTRNSTLLEKHGKALVPSDVAEFSADLETAVFDGGAYFYSDEYGVDTSVRSVLSILNTINEWKHSILVAKGFDYRRRGVKRIAGVRNEDGSVTEPHLNTRYLDDSDYMNISAIEMNRNTATINMRVTRPIRLFSKESGDDILNVAGVDVSNLTDYRNYTLVSDGEVNVPYLTLKFTDKRAFKALHGEGTFDPNIGYVINLTGRPLVDFEQDFSNIDGVYEKLLGFKVLGSILTSLTSDASEKYTDEQLKALKDHYITGSLNVSFPTTTEYSDLKTALTDGTIDTRVSFKVDIGNSKVLNASKMKSANAYLQRRFEATSGGVKYSGTDLKWGLWWDPTFTVGLKNLSAKTKLDSVDEFMMPIFTDLLLKNEGVVDKILLDAGMSKVDIEKFEKVFNHDRTLSRDESVEILKSTLHALKNAEDEIYTTKVCPLAFYIGATGLLPDSFDSQALTGDAIMNSHPDLKLSKEEKEGTFFVVGNSILTVFMSSEYFSRN
jgi:hypothetical protein